MAKKFRCPRPVNRLIMHRTKSLSGPFFQNTGNGVCIKSTGNYYAPGMPGAGVRAYAIETVIPDRVRIYFSACVNTAAFTGIEVQVNGGGWQQTTGIVKVTDQIYTWQSSTSFGEGDTVQWRYLGGTDSIVDCVDASDIGEQGPLTEVVPVGPGLPAEFIATGVAEGVWKALIAAADGTNTYSARDTAATFVNSDGYVQEVPAYTIRPEGARVVENVIGTASAAISPRTEPINTDHWRVISGASDNVAISFETKNGKEAVKLVFSSGFSGYTATGTTTGVDNNFYRHANKFYILSGRFILSRTLTGAESLEFYCNAGGISTSNPINANNSASFINDWGRLSSEKGSSGTDSANTVSYLFPNDSNLLSELTVWLTDLQLEDVTPKAVQNAPSEYVSVGVLADDGLFHGCGVDGIKAYATSAHNNSVDANGVVTEGTASGDISDDIYYLAEPAATNDVTHSYDLDNAVWVKTAVTAVVIDSLSGINHGVELTDTAIDSQFRISHTCTVTAGEHVFSAYVKAGTLSVAGLLTYGAVAPGADLSYFDLSDESTQIDTNHTLKLFEDAGSGWYRIAVGVTTTGAGTLSIGLHLSTGKGTFHYLGDGTGTLSFADCQVEEGSVPTAIMHTNGAAFTRTADLVKYDIAGNHNQDAGTLVLKWKTALGQPDWLGTIGTNNGVVSYSTGAASILYLQNTASITSYDNTNSAVIHNPVFDAGDEIYLAVRWNAANNEKQVGYKNITQDASWVWSTVATYDGEYLIHTDNQIRLFQIISLVQKMEELSIYQTDKGTDWIEANY